MTIQTACGRRRIATACLAGLLLSVGLSSGQVAHAVETITGRVHEIAGADHPMTVLNTDQGELLLRFAPGIAPPASGSTVEVTGERLGDAFLVASSRTMADPPNRSSGAREVLVIAIGWDETNQSQIRLRHNVFTGPDSVARFYAEASHGQTTMVGRADPANGDVAGPFIIDRGEDPCPFIEWGRAGRHAAEAAGFDVRAYDHVIHHFPFVDTCRWLGLGVVNGAYSWLNGAYNVMTITHELGHNLGLRHANGYRCSSNGTPTTIDGTCESVEYGDPLDPMGTGVGVQGNSLVLLGGGTIHFSVFHKERLGWLPEGDLQRVSSSGIYTISALSAGSGVRGLQVDRRSGKGKGKGGVKEFFYVDYRVAEPVFEANLHTVPTRGAWIRLAPDPKSFSKPNLLDMTPETDTFRDASLLPGMSFRDEVGGVTITTMSMNADALTIEVLFHG